MTPERSSQLDHHRIAGAKGRRRRPDDRGIGSIECSESRRILGHNQVVRRTETRARREIMRQPRQLPAVQSPRRGRRQIANLDEGRATGGRGIHDLVQHQLRHRTNDDRETLRGRHGAQAVIDHLDRDGIGGGAQVGIDGPGKRPGVGIDGRSGRSTARQRISELLDRIVGVLMPPL